MDLENKEVPALVVSEAAPESEHLSERVITGGLPVTEETATIEEEVVEEPVARSAAWIADDTEERRVGYLTNAELRADGDGSTLVGYAAMFDSPSEDLGGFTERIAPGAFKRTLSAWTPTFDCSLTTKVYRLRVAKAARFRSRRTNSVLRSRPLLIQTRQ